MPSAYSEARAVLDWVERGLLDASAARELIVITPTEEETLLGAVETPFDARLVHAAVVFRRQVLEHFDRLLAPPCSTLADPDRAALDYIMACK